MIALCDVNNFYVSCERVFDPAIWHRPVIVLSNNDGCAIARSKTVKKLGIKLGDPLFKIKHLVRQHNIAIYSSNYALYGDMSRRIDDIIADYSDQVENYSIDESFIRFNGFEHLNLLTHCQDMVQRIWQWLGLPVSVGLASTKTLAKVATNHVKKNKIPGQVFVLSDEEPIKQILADLPVIKIWGIGSKSAQYLNEMGIITALDLRNSDLKSMRKRFSVVMERTILELRGVSCIDFEFSPNKKQQIICTRSFGKKTNDLQAIKEAVAYHTTRACVTLREQESQAQVITVGLSCSFHNVQYRQQTQSVCVKLPHASDYTGDFLNAASKAVQQLYKQGIDYKKAGIMLNNISDIKYSQGDLFAPASTGQHKLMQTMDKINNQFGKGTIRSGQEGFAIAGLCLVIKNLKNTPLIGNS